VLRSRFALVHRFHRSRGANRNRNTGTYRLSPLLDSSNARIHTPRPMTLMLESSSIERSLPTAGRESFA